MQTILKRMGHSTTVADNGQIGVDLCQPGIFDVVLMDMQMPVMDGLAATRVLRENPDLADLPIIALTANAFEDDRRRCFEAGMDEFIAKPLKRDLIITALERWGRGREAAQGESQG